MFAFFDEVLSFFNLIGGLIVSALESLAFVTLAISNGIPTVTAMAALSPFPLLSWVLLSVMLGIALSLVGIFYGR